MNMITKSTGMNTMNKNIKKTSQGRKKIEIKKIEEGNSRQVTFSKRRTGIFKKAAELCVLTGSEIAIIVNSPGGRVYACGHPNPDVIIDRYLNTNNAEGTPTSQIPPLVIKEFNQFYVQKSMELEAEKRRKEMIQVSKTVNGDGLPWYHVNFDIDGMEVDKLEPYLLALVELKKKVLVRADEVEMIKKNPKFVGFEHVGCKHVGFEHARSGHVGFNMLDIGDLGCTNEIPNTMIPTNNMDTADMF